MLDLLSGYLYSTTSFSISNHIYNYLTGTGAPIIISKLLNLAYTLFSESREKSYSPKPIQVIPNLPFTKSFTLLDTPMFSGPIQSTLNSAKISTSRLSKQTSNFNHNYTGIQIFTYHANHIPFLGNNVSNSNTTSSYNDQDHGHKEKTHKKSSSTHFETRNPVLCTSISSFSPRPIQITLKLPFTNSFKFLDTPLLSGPIELTLNSAKSSTSRLSEQTKNFNHTRILTTLNKANETILPTNGSYLNIEDLKEIKDIKNLFTFINTNIRSLNRNYGKLVNLLAELSFQPSIISVTETWLSGDKYFLGDVQGYKFIGTNSNTRAGGTGFLIRKDINYEILKCYKLQDGNSECMWINVKLSKSKNIIIGTVYRHPMYDIETFENEFVKIIDDMNLNKRSYLIGGDFNIDLNKKTTSVLSYLDNLTSCGCSQMVKESTRFMRNASPSLIDHVYTNLPERDTTIKILIKDISDHLPVLTIYQHHFNPSTNETIYRRDFTTFNAESFLNHLDFSMNILYEDPNLNADSVCSKFVEIYKSIVDHHAPMKMITTKNKKLKRNPWITHSILKKIRKKNSRFKKFIKQKTNYSYEQYKKLRNKITREVEKEKKKYYNKLFSKTKSNPKFLWNSINKTINYKPSKSYTIKEMENRNGETTTNSNDISNIFNEYFSSIGETLSKKIYVLDENFVNNIKKKTNIAQ